MHTYTCTRTHTPIFPLGISLYLFIPFNLQVRMSLARVKNLDLSITQERGRGPAWKKLKYFNDLEVNCPCLYYKQTYTFFY